MNAMLINSCGGCIAYINEKNRDAALMMIADDWLPILEEGDIIQIQEVEDAY